jgi:Cu(I)/Ag(I) efflux system membrane protein CusA/SilA
MQVPLRQVAEVRISDGPAMIKSENARLHGWTFIDIRGVDLGSYIRMAQRQVANKVMLPPGYSISWSGQFEHMQRAEQRLWLVVPMTLAIVFTLLYLTFRRAGEALLVMATLPFALVGGFWLLFALGYPLSVATAVGFIALTGVAAEFGVIMLLYLDSAIEARRAEGRLRNRQDLRAAIVEGAVLRVRPKVMTVSVIVAGLLPIMVGAGTGSDLMRHIAAPMIGGMITAPLLSLFGVPLVYLWWKGRALQQGS